MPALVSRIASSQIASGLQHSVFPAASAPRRTDRILRNLRHHSSDTKQDASRKDQEPPQMPKFSLDGLGATPGMKALIYTAFGVLATVETYTYSLWIYHKVYPEGTGEDSAQSDGSGSRA